MIQRPSDFVRKVNEDKLTSTSKNYLRSASEGVKKASSGTTLHVFTRNHSEPGSDQLWKGGWS